MRPVAILGGGASLTQAQVDLCRGRAQVIAINDAFRLAPWAEHLHATDLGFWCDIAPDASQFPGRKTVVRPAAADSVWDAKYRHGPTVGVEALLETGKHGFDPNPGHIRTGYNSGYAALHLAVQEGAQRVLLLGFDMRPGGWARPSTIRTNSTFSDRWLPAFDTLAPALAERGCEVVNCTPDSALQIFETGDLDHELNR